MTEPTPEPRPEDETSAIEHVFEQLTTDERLVTIGALLVAVVAWLLGDVLFDDYSVADLAWVLSLWSLVAVYHFFKGAKTGWHQLYPGLLAVAAVSVAALGAAALLEDFGRYTSPGVLSWFFRLVYYAGAGLMGWGGVQLLRSR